MPARRKYAWERWLTEPRTVIVRGADYQCSQSAMWQQVKSEAWRRGVRVRVRDENDRLVIEVLGGTGTGVDAGAAPAVAPEPARP